jgi:hypothetical protein
MTPSKKHNGEQVVSINTRIVKWFQKDGTTKIIKHKFICRIIYEQNVPSMCVRKSQKNKSRFSWKMGFSILTSRKWSFF